MIFNVTYESRDVKKRVDEKIGLYTNYIYIYVQMYISGIKKTICLDCYFEKEKSFGLPNWLPSLIDT